MKEQISLSQFVSEQESKFPKLRVRIEKLAHEKIDNLQLQFKSHIDKGAQVSTRKRTVTSVITNGNVDLEGEVILAEGIDMSLLETLRRVFYEHRSIRDGVHELPIGKMLALDLTHQNDWVACTYFLKNPFAETLWQLYSESINGTGPVMDGWSVGFIPISWVEKSQRGFSQALDLAIRAKPDVKLLIDQIRRIAVKSLGIEYSTTSIGANTDAISLAVEKGIVTAPGIKSLGIILPGKLEETTTTKSNIETLVIDPPDPVDKVEDIQPITDLQPTEKEKETTDEETGTKEREKGTDEEKGEKETGVQSGAETETGKEQTVETGKGSGDGTGIDAAPLPGSEVKIEGGEKKLEDKGRVEVKNVKLYERQTVINKSVEGIEKKTFEDLMNYMNFTIPVFDMIDEYSAQRVVDSLFSLSAFDPEAEITLLINSPGGLVDAGFAIIDAIEMVPNDVRTIGMGQVCSMGLLITMAGERGKRFVSPNTSILAHRFYASFDGSQADFEAYAKQLDIVHQRIVTFCLINSNLTTTEEVESRLIPKTDNWLTVGEAIELGLIDGVVRDASDILPERVVTVTEEAPAPEEETAKAKAEVKTLDNLEVKSAIPYSIHPASLEVIDDAWDGTAATKRLREWAGYETDNMDWGKYAKGFAWRDTDNPEVLSSYKLAHHDIQDGKLVISRKGCHAAIAAINGARSKPDISEDERKGSYNHIAKHYRDDLDEEVPEYKSLDLIEVETKILPKVEEVEKTVIQLKRSLGEVAKIVIRLNDKKPEVKKEQSKPAVQITRDQLTEIAAQAAKKASEKIDLAATIKQSLDTVRGKVTPQNIDHFKPIKPKTSGKK